jgi:radical SAM superfamily enzyme YgiQ (UPF0313 family)
VDTLFSKLAHGGTEMRIHLVEPDSPGKHIFSRFRMPRLGAVLLATVLDRLGHRTEVQIEVAAPLELERLERADLVGISTITPTAPRAYEIADRLRLVGVKVVIGGPHPTFLPDEALEHADFAVRGEGEGSLPALVRALEQGGGDERLRRVPGLTWRAFDGRAVHNPLPEPVAVAELPAPDWSLVRAGVRPDGRVGSGSIPMQTSRGCPYDCTFCSVTSVFGRRMRYQPASSVVERIAAVGNRNRYVFFYDDNFAVSRDRVGEICEGLLDAGLSRIKWTAQVRADVARDPELLRLMRRAGAHTFFIGLESAHPATLAAARKRQRVDQVREHLRRIRRAGIRVHGMFVLGLDQDTPESVDATVRFAIDERISSAQFLVLVPLPGTEVFDRLEDQGRLVVRDWSLYDGHHVVFRPRGFTMSRLQRAQIDAHDRFYPLSRQLGWLMRGRLFESAIGGYARRLNRTWKRTHAQFLARLERLDTGFAAGLSLPRSASRGGA